MLSLTFAISVICLGVDLFGFILFGTLCFLWVDICILCQVREVFSHYFFRQGFFFFCIFLFSPSNKPIMQISAYLMLSQRSLKLSSFKKFLFAVLIGWFPLLLSSRLLIHSSVSSNLLFIPSSVFFLFQLLYSLVLTDSFLYCLKFLLKFFSPEFNGYPYSCSFEFFIG